MHQVCHFAGPGNGGRDWCFIAKIAAGLSHVATKPLISLPTHEGAKPGYIVAFRILFHLCHQCMCWSFRLQDLSLWFITRSPLALARVAPPPPAKDESTDAT